MSTIPPTLLLRLRRAVAAGTLQGYAAAVRQASDAQVDWAFRAMRDLAPACDEAVALAGADLIDPLDDIETHEILGACVRSVRGVLGSHERPEEWEALVAELADVLQAASANALQGVLDDREAALNPEENPFHDDGFVPGR